VARHGKWVPVDVPRYIACGPQPPQGRSAPPLPAPATCCTRKCEYSTVLYCTVMYCAPSVPVPRQAVDIFLNACISTSWRYLCRKRGIWGIEAEHARDKGSAAWKVRRAQVHLEDQPVLPTAGGVQPGRLLPIDWWEEHRYGGGCDPGGAA